MPKFIETDEDFEAWPDCAVEGCENKACIVLDSEFCFPHTPGSAAVKRMNIAARRIVAGLDAASPDEMVEIDSRPTDTDSA